MLEPLEQMFLAIGAYANASVLDRDHDYISSPARHSCVLVASIRFANSPALKKTTLRGYEIDRSLLAPTRTVVLFSPFVSFTNLMALLTRFVAI